MKQHQHLVYLLWFIWFLWEIFICKKNFLDTFTERQIQSALRSVCEGRTTLIVAHRLSTISHADIIIVLREGEIAERGSHDELLAKPDSIYAAMWQEQSSSYSDADKPTTSAGDVDTNNSLNPKESHHHHHS